MQGHGQLSPTNILKDNFDEVMADTALAAAAAASEQYRFIKGGEEKQCKIEVDPSVPGDAKESEM